MTVPEGASLADTKRRLVLRTFASTGGDAARTAKIVGISPEDVKNEIASLIRTNGDGNHAEPVSPVAPTGVARDVTRSHSAPAKTKARKR
jgi:NADP-dependent 3-hydroxy acid dehydrogenase YdfG